MSLNEISSTVNESLSTWEEEGMMNLIKLIRKYSQTVLYHDKKRHGMINKHSNCYFNSILQCLLGLPCFVLDIMKASNPSIDQEHGDSGINMLANAIIQLEF